MVLQPDLQITNIGTASDGPPAQMVFGPDGRLYMTLANFSGPKRRQRRESFAYSQSGGLLRRAYRGLDRRAFSASVLRPRQPRSLRLKPGVQTVTGMYLTDTARTINGNDVLNLAC